MRLLLVASLALWTPFARANPPQAVSQAPSISIQFAGTEGSDYRFIAYNSSSQAVTGLSFRLIPSGVPLGQGGYLCKGRCGSNTTSASKAKPVIRPNGSASFTFEISSVGNALILQAALFDDSEYQGQEQAAAGLVAIRFGDQNGFNQVQDTAGRILANSGMNDAQKAGRLLVELDSLSGSPDAAMLNSFNAQFPNLTGCDYRYAAAMKTAAVTVIRNAEEKVQEFLSGSVPKGTSLSSWWDSTTEFLNGAGCKGCTINVTAGSGHIQAAANACGHGQVPPSVADVVYGTEIDASDDSADGTQAEEVVSNQPNVSPSPTPTPTTVASAAPPAPPTTPSPSVSAPSHPAPSIAAAPTVIGGTPTGRPLGLEEGTTSASLRPPISPVPGVKSLTGVAKFLPDDFIYDRYFRYVVELDRYASQLEANGQDGSAWRAREQTAIGFTAKEWMNVKDVAMSCNLAVTANNDKRQAALQAYTGQWPKAIAWTALPLFPRRPWDEEKIKIVMTHVDQLRTRLGPNSFHKFDSYLHTLFKTAAAKTVFEPATDAMMYSFFFDYVRAISHMNADYTVRAWQSKVQEQAGLSDQEWAILALTASSYTQTIVDNMRQRARQSAGPSPAPAPVRQDQQGEAAAQKNQIINDHIDRLKEALGETSFRKVDTFVHNLYKLYSVPKYVPLAPIDAKVIQSTPVPASPMPMAPPNTAGTANQQQPPSPRQ